MKNKNYKNLMWKCWNIPTNIEQLTDYQLHNIRKLINSSKKQYHFGNKKEVWLEAINSILIKRNKEVIDVIKTIINNTRVERAELYANYIINNILKSSNETLSVKQL